MAMASASLARREAPVNPFLLGIRLHLVKVILSTQTKVGKEV